jgi:large subunit ribosomal protein L28
MDSCRAGRTPRGGSRSRVAGPLGPVLPSHPTTGGRFGAALHLPTTGSAMARRCQLTGAVGRSGNNISHSHRRTKRRFEINIQTKRYWVPSEQRFVSLTVSAKAIKTIDRRGIEAVVRELRARGEKI